VFLCLSAIDFDFGKASKLLSLKHFDLAYHFGFAKGFAFVMLLRFAMRSKLPSSKHFDWAYHSLFVKASAFASLTNFAFG
jgi:hypothetical protein